MKRILFVLLSLGVLGGCTNQDVGVLSGGAIGGAIGSQFGGGSGQILATVGGALVGAYLGGKIGKSMDEVDRMKMTGALENTKTGQSQTWTNPDNGNRYTVQPTKTYYHRTNRGSQPCRDFTTRAVIDGKTETVYGRACRKADGTWKMVQ